MNARKALISLVAAVTLAASGGYLFVYLYRWEWNRALISGVIFLAAEIAVIGWALNSKISELGRQVDTMAATRIAGHLDAARQDQPSHAFDWLERSTTRTNVFVPILLSAGLILSGLGWVVEKLGKATAGRTSDRQLAAHLSRLAPPPGGFLDDHHDPLRDLRGPVGGRW
jgi:hypothetical protein